MGRNEGLVDLLLELQSLDRVPRAGFRLRGITECESVTEHSWHLAFLVWAVAPQVPGIDLARALELALVHDLAEVRTGDLPRTASRYFPDGAKKTAERAVLADLLAPLGEEAQELYGDYEAGRSLEARLVRACDKLQLLIKASAYEQWGATGMAEFWEESVEPPDQGLEVIQEIREALRHRRPGRQ